MKSKNEGSEKLPNQQTPAPEPAYGSYAWMLKSLAETQKTIEQTNSINEETSVILALSNKMLQELITSVIPQPAAPVHPSPKKQARKKTIHLICVNDGPMVDKDGKIITSSIPIAFLDRYTSTGKEIDKHGRWCYPINELNARFLAERFVVSKAPIKNKSL